MGLSTSAGTGASIVASRMPNLCQTKGWGVGAAGTRGASCASGPGRAASGSARSGRPVLAVWGRRTSPKYSNASHRDRQAGTLTCRLTSLPTVSRRVANS